MKDYEKVELYEKRLFDAKERRNFLKASLDAFDAGIEEKKTTFERMTEDYNENVKRIQDTLAKIDAEIVDLEGKLNISKDAQFKNAHKGKKASRKKKEVKKEDPKPTFIEEPKKDKIAELLGDLPDKPNTNGNGKKTCPICNGEFSPQGIHAHLKSCIAKAEKDEGD